MTNILDAIYNISHLKELTVKDIAFGNNRATSVGEGLESFVKDAFTNTFNEADKQKRQEKYDAVFSYQGSKRTPPDLMLKGGDAIEIKKTELLTTELQLNSSHPKARLFSSSKLINKNCRNCEDWDVKDFVYAIGHVPKGGKILSTLWFIYGTLYAAEESVYTTLKESMTKSIEEAPGISFSPTNEIGRVNHVDALGISNLRIRGMWLLNPPYKVFDYVHGYETDKKFQLIALIPNHKYNSFPLMSRNRIEAINTPLTIQTVQVKDPNNPTHLIDCQLIKYTI